MALRSKDGLRPGMLIQQNKSGNIGKLRGQSGKKGKLDRHAPWRIGVKYRQKGGRNDGRWVYRTWNLANISLAQTFRPDVSFLDGAQC